MEAAYLRRLSPDVAAIVEAIEAKTGVEIEIEVQTDRRTMACQIDCDGQRILTPSQQYFQDGSVLHELLHIRRIAVEGIPQIVDCEDCHDISAEAISGLSSLDNTLEHLVIVPEELLLRAERRGYWEERLSKALDKLEQKTLNSEDTKRWILLNGLFQELALPNSPSEARLRQLEQEYAVVEDARDFRVSVGAFIKDKERMVVEVFRLLTLPAHIAALEYFDIANGTSEEIPLADLLQ
jgi:hypothetical protein